MALLYADENFPFPVVSELRQFGHDVLTTQEAGKAEQSVPDEEILAFASGLGRAVLTLNRKHFIHLHRAQPAVLSTSRSVHAGIIVCTFDPDFIGQAKRIHAAIVSEAQLSDKLIRVNRPPS